jgi:hypothetical protein
MYREGCVKPSKKHICSTRKSGSGLIAANENGSIINESSGANMAPKRIRERLLHACSNTFPNKD